jgi:transcriptional regulator with XRE-family HTH domain
MTAYLMSEKIGNMSERPKTPTPAPVTKAKESKTVKVKHPSVAAVIQSLKWHGERLTELMEARGVNKNQLAVAMGVHASGPKRWSEEGVIPEWENLIGLCVFFHVPVTFFFAIEGQSARGTLAGLIRNSIGEDEAEVLEAMDSVPAAKKGLLVQMARNYRSQ